MRHISAIFSIAKKCSRPFQQLRNLSSITDEIAREFGFEKLGEQTNPEGEVVCLRHKSGAVVVSHSDSNEEKMLTIAFRTPPRDSTGVAHILEHAIFCGSRKYPVKDLCFELQQCCSYTVMDASTSMDHTKYTVASTSLKDYYTLCDAYFDAVFHPKCITNSQSMQQEGCRLEFDSSGNLSFRGIVLSEMKGYYSDPLYVLAGISQRVLFPDSTYGFDYGGQPQDITSLTFSEFQPDPSFSFSNNGERENLERLKSNMTTEDLKIVEETTAEFKHLQIPIYATSFLQSSSDPIIPGQSSPDPIIPGMHTEVVEIGSAKLLLNHAGTNGNVFIDVAFDMSCLKPEHIPLLPLFCMLDILPRYSLGTMELYYRKEWDKSGPELSVYPYVSAVQGNSIPCAHLLFSGCVKPHDVQSLLNKVNNCIQLNKFYNIQQIPHAATTTCESWT